MERKTSKLTIMLFAFIIILSICASFTIQVNAANCPICSGTHKLSDLGGLQRTAYDMCCVVYGGTSISDDIIDTLKFDVTGDKFSDLWERGRGFYESLATIGELLCIIYGLISMYEKISQDQHSAEHIFKLFMKIFLGIILMRSGYDIVEAGLNFASQVFITFQGSTTGISSTDGCIFEEIAKMQFLEPVGMILSMFIPWLAMLAASIALNVVVWARILDIMVRVIFSPIGMADIMHTGINGSGMLYLKKIVSSAIQGSVLFGSMKAYSLIVTAINNTDGAGAGGVMVVIILSFSLISILFKAKTIADDLLGI